MSEKVLGCIRVERLTISFRHQAIQEALVFTPNRVFVGRIGETPQSGWGMTGWIDSVVDLAVYAGISAIEGHEAEKKRRKSEELLKVDLEEFLKADKHNYVIPNSEITKVELKKFGKYGAKIHIRTNKKKHKWHTIFPVVKSKGEGILSHFRESSYSSTVKLEDYENMLRPIFGDKLSVKK